jgi:hypothetical protein
MAPQPLEVPIVAILAIVVTTKIAIKLIIVSTNLSQKEENG